MGDWNIKYSAFRDAVLTAGDTVQAQALGSTSVCAKKTDQRDMVVVFHENRHWVVDRDDAIPEDTYKDLKDVIGGDHEVLFFCGCSLGTASAGDDDSPSLAAGRCRG